MIGVRVFDCQLAIISDQDTSPPVGYYFIEQALKAGKFELEPACDHNGKMVIKVDFRTMGDKGEK